MINSISEFIYFNKKKIFIVFLVLFIGIGGGIYYLCYDDLIVNSEEETIVEESSDLVIEKKEDVVKEEPKEVNACFFDIKGQVKNPGVYSLNCSGRVIDAIAKAGGLTDDSDTSVINLSKKIEDGMVIIIYSKQEVEKYLESLNQEEEKKTICENGKIINDACVNTNSDANQKTNNSSLININTASLEQLMTLTGIGESKAKQIIAYREKTPFTKIEDLMLVDGIGESIYSKIKENITV